MWPKIAPDSISNVAENWLGGVNSKIKKLTFVGASFMVDYE